MWSLAFLAALLAAAAEPAAIPAPRPRLVASGGLRYHAPEDTLPAFAAALELHVGVEVPVRRTRDGKLAVVGDNRKTGLPPVADVPLGELRKLDAGSWFDREYAGERVATLDEVLALANAWGAGELASPELRRGRGREPSQGSRDSRQRSPALVVLDLQAEGVEVEVARLVGGKGLAAQVVCTGLPAHDPAARKRLHATAPRLGLAAAAPRPDDLEGAVTAPDADWVLVGFMPSAADAARVHKAGRRLMAAPAAAGYDPDVCARALEAQLDALVTDFPLECRALWRSVERR
jgi:glycerophosphoryl diester phosphodiesterase